MHSLEAGPVVFNFNGDFSGDVHIGVYGSHEKITVPFSALVALVAEAKRREAISGLEQMSDWELIGMEEP
jgi:hypothetical protein